MKIIAAAALSLALLGAGTVGAMAQTSGSTTPPNGKETAAQAHWRHHNDPVGDRYTDALNILEANGYTGITDIVNNGKTYDAKATDPSNKPVSVTVDPSTGTVKTNS
jgi:hypothetical protein